MFTQSRLGNLLAAFGAVGGAFYMVKKGGNLTKIGFAAVGGGLAGFILGNAFTNFYYDN
jgi:hypothetical protein